MFLLLYKYNKVVVNIIFEIKSKHHDSRDGKIRTYEYSRTQTERGDLSPTSRVFYYFCSPGRNRTGTPVGEWHFKCHVYTCFTTGPTFTYPICQRTSFVHPTRVELITYALEVRCSIQLSYGCIL